MRPTPLMFLLTQAQAVGDTTGGLWDGGIAGTSVPWVPLVLLLGPAVIAAVLITWYVRTARQLKRVQLAPPAWLVPYLHQPSGPPGPGARPPLDPDDALTDEARFESTTVLARRKRALLMALALNFIAGWAGAGVYLYGSSRTVEFQDLPATSSIGSSIDTLRFQGVEDRAGAPADPAPSPPAPAPAPVAAPVDSAALRRFRDQQIALGRRQDSLALARQRDSVSLVAETERMRDSMLAAVRDSVLRTLTAVAPAPAPPPPPPPAPPPPDPAAERALATTAIRGAGIALVRAVNARTGLDALLAAGPSRNRFLQFVQAQAPSAALADVAEPTMAVGQAVGMVTLRFQWRGPFGDTRRGTGRFQAEARQDGSGWRIVTLTSMDNLP